MTGLRTKQPCSLNCNHKKIRPTNLSCCSPRDQINKQVVDGRPQQCQSSSKVSSKEAEDEGVVVAVDVAAAEATAMPTTRIKVNNAQVSYVRCVKPSIIFLTAMNSKVRRSETDGTSLGITKDVLLACGQAIALMSAEASSLVALMVVIVFTTSSFTGSKNRMMARIIRKKNRLIV